MPYLEKPKRKYKSQLRKDRQGIYQSKRWKNLRDWYLLKHPLCEMCLAMGKIKPAIDVHHKDGFTNYSGYERIYKAYEIDNLIALCKECHSFLHRNGKTHGLDLQREIKEYKLLNKEEND